MWVSKTYFFFNFLVNSQITETHLTNVDSARKLNHTLFLRCDTGCNFQHGITNLVQYKQAEGKKFSHAQLQRVKDCELYLTEQFDERALSLGSDRITPVAVTDLLSDEPARAAVQVSSSVVSSSVGEV
jgi:hypothetical protein